MTELATLYAYQMIIPETALTLGIPITLEWLQYFDRLDAARIRVLDYVNMPSVSYASPRKNRSVFRRTEQTYQELLLLCKRHRAFIDLLRGLALRLGVFLFGKINFARHFHRSPGSLIFGQGVLKGEIEICWNVKSDVKVEVVRNTTGMTTEPNQQSCQRGMQTAWSEGY
jgi:hypothetical protein